ASMASTAVLGSVLVPDMEKRGYKKHMILGPILGSGGLAMMIPLPVFVPFIDSLGFDTVGSKGLAFGPSEN
ncbi:MAG: TRAP transporter large permease subunit, partial [Deltaproteobacteria bacterium]|nr:TRAP transporter large permease subunit [Deltaproteobacteria bacterium]